MGLEFRYPFFDRRLVEFLLVLAQQNQCRGESPRFLLRTSMQDLLPKKLLCRERKADFRNYVWSVTSAQTSVAHQQDQSSLLDEWGIINDSIFKNACSADSFSFVLQRWLTASVFVETWARRNFIS
jgi:asparagine synthetase B (glutamine-hydrolysing)